jgi:transposase-like protein
MLCRPVEGIRRDRFRPTHCPFAACPAHRGRERFRYRRHGEYRKPADPRHTIPRFRCGTCRRTFSRQSFACSYYLKRPELLVPIAAGLVAGSAHRQLARSLGCAPSTVTRLAARLGRHSLLLHALALEHVEHISEPVVLDHFETFVYSQDDRLGIATAVGQRSWFVYGIQPAPHRRAGRRSARKKAVRAVPPEPSPESVVRSTLDTLDVLIPRASNGLTLVSDDNPAYRAAASRHPRARTLRHRVYPNPPRGPETDPATAFERDRQMGAVDVLHKLWRHSQAHHRRETIAFGRRTNAVLERAALMLCWRNLVKGVSERKGDRTTPAMRLEITPRPWSWKDALARRLFPGRLTVPEPWMRIYRREWITPAVGRNLPHDLRHAF